MLSTAKVSNHIPAGNLKIILFITRSHNHKVKRQNIFFFLNRPQYTQKQQVQLVTLTVASQIIFKTKIFALHALYIIPSTTHSWRHEGNLNRHKPTTKANIQASNVPSTSQFPSSIPIQPAQPRNYVTQPNQSVRKKYYTVFYILCMVGAPRQVCYKVPCAQLSTRLTNMAVTFVVDRLPVLTSTSRKKMSLVLTLKSNSFAQYFTRLPLQQLLNNKQFYTCFTQLKQQCEQSIMRTIQQIATNATIQCNKICHW